MDEIAEQNPIWERQPWDTDNSYAFFRDHYLALSPPRPIRQAWRSHVIAKAVKAGKPEPTKISSVPSAIYLWANAKDKDGNSIPGAIPWSVRAEAYDDHLKREEDRLWLERKLEVRKQEWEVANRLLERAMAMLATPLFRETEKTDPDGEQIIVIEPIKWKESDIAKTALAASQLLRKAAEMETERVAVVDWRQEVKEAGLDAGDLFEKLVTEIATHLTGSDGQDDGGGLPGSPDQA